MEPKMTTTISALVRKVRTTRGLSQDEMAKTLRVSVNYISLIENGKKNPGSPFLRKFSRAYGIPLLLLTRDTIVPQAKTPKERELRDKVLNLLSEFENAFI